MFFITKWRIYIIKKKRKKNIKNNNQQFMYSKILLIFFFCLIFQYLKIARHLDGYGEVMFPHCACDSRKDGHVIAIVGTSCFKLQACKADGTLEVRNKSLICTV